LTEILAVMLNNYRVPKVWVTH